MNVFLNEACVSAYNTPCANIVIFEAEQDNTHIFIDKEYKISSVRPLGLKIPVCNDFFFETGKKVIIEFENEKPLFIFTYKKESVNKSDYTYYFETGVHSVADIVLENNDSIYLEAGAVLKAHISADNADNIKICGRGIIDTTEIGSKTHRMIRLIECNNINVSDVTLIGAIDWALVPIACENVKVCGINIITWEVNGDGIDLVGCKNVYIYDCFLHCADDCIVIKATARDDIRGCRNSENIRVEKCALWNTRPGNALEIGFGTKCEEIHNITFSDCDVLHCEYEGWEAGGVMTIHNSDRATVHNITYENIRVENAEHKLFDFKVILSKYSTDNERGYIKDINIRNVYVYGECLPPSILRGNDNQHGVKNVRINGLYHNDKKISSKLSGHFITESGSEVIFED